MKRRRFWVCSECAAAYKGLLRKGEELIINDGDDDKYCAWGHFVDHDLVYSFAAPTVPPSLPQSEYPSPAAAIAVTATYYPRTR